MRKNEKVSTFYIDRRLWIWTAETNHIKQLLEEENNVVIISCKTSVQNKLSHISFQNHNLVFIDTETSFLTQKFYEFCEKHSSDVNLYAFQHVEDCFALLLQKSNQSLKFLIKKEILDKNLLKICSLGAVCGPVGIGKSELFKYLSQHEDLNFEMVYLDLTKFAKFWSTDPNYEKIKTKFFKRCKRKKGKRYLLFDGLDAIKSNCIDVFLHFVKENLSEDTKIWISSRNHLTQKIYQTLNFVSIEIAAFNENEKYLFIHKQFSSPAKKICDQFQENDSMNEISQNPLYLQIMTEMFYCNKKAYKVFKEEEVIATTSIFQEFFVTKTKKDLKHYKILALKECLEESDFDKLDIDMKTVSKSLTKIHKQGDQYGIIKEVNKNVIFTHRIYAEYFSCVWFQENKDKYALLQNELFSPKYSELRRMFDILLAERSPLHLSVIYKNLKQFKKFQKMSRTDQGGRTVAHLAFSYQSDYQEKEPFYKLLIEHLFENDFDQFARDELLNATPFDYAILANCLYPIERSLQDKVTAPNNFIKKLIDSNGLTFLKSVIQFGYPNLLNEILESNPVFIVRKYEEDSLLHLAMAVDNNIQIMTLLIKYEVNVNGKNRSGKTALEVAIENNCVKNVEFFLSAKLAPIGSEYGPFFLACSKKRPEIVELFIKFGQNLNLRDENGNAALFMASKSGFIDNAKLLITNGSDVDALNTNQESALHYACNLEKQNTEVIQLLLKHNLNVNARTKCGLTPLHIACEKGVIENVQLLVKHQADLKALNNKKQSSLHRASLSKKNNKEVISFLLGCDQNQLNFTGNEDSKKEKASIIFDKSNALNVNSKDKNFDTPLLLACRMGVLENVVALIEKGGNVEDVRIFNQSALHCASQSDNINTEVIRLLISYDMNVNATDIAGNTPLHLACQKGCLQNVKTLLKNEADLSVSRVFNQNVLHCASQSIRTNIEVINFLIHLGIDVNAKDSNGNTALLLAVKAKCAENVKFLMERKNAI